MTNTPGAARAAMDAALHLLKFRGRTEKEMAERLAKKGFGAEAAATVARLKELKLLDDDALARQWVESGRRAGWGEGRLKQALWKRGVPKDAVARALAEAPAEGGASEADRAREALEKRLKRAPAGLDPRALYRRMGGYLARQGFSPDVVHETLAHHLPRSADPADD